MTKPVSQTDTAARPQRDAFVPVTKNELLGDLMVAGIFLAAFLTGLIANIYSGFENFSSLATRSSQYTIFYFLLQILIYYAFPFFLLGSAYYLWHAWNRRRKTNEFLFKRRRCDGIISHLWKEPPSGSGKKYYVGYQYGEGKTARQTVHPRVFQRLQAGQPVGVDYLPDDPTVSSLVISPPGKRSAGSPVEEGIT